MCLCDLVERSCTSELGHHGSLLSKGDVGQPFRPPRTGTGNIDRSHATIDQRSYSTNISGPTRPNAVVRPPSESTGHMRPSSYQQSSVHGNTNTAARGTTAAAGKPAAQLSQKAFGAVSGGHGTTASSGPLRQLQLTDSTSLPASVQQQLYLGECSECYFSLSSRASNLMFLCIDFVRITNCFYDYDFLRLCCCSSDLCFVVIFVVVFRT